MSQHSTRDQIIHLIEQLPENATVEDALEKLYFLYKIERGISQADTGQKISQDEARMQMERWLK